MLKNHLGMFICKDYLAEQNEFHKLLFAKIQWKIPLAFCQGNRTDANFGVGLQK